MRRKHPVSRSTQFLSLLTVALVAFAARSALAQDHYIVQPDGSRTPLVRSETELAVIVSEGKPVAAMSRTLATEDIGVIEDFDHAPFAPVKRLRTNGPAKARMSAAKAQPGIIEVHPIFRTMQGDLPLVSTGTINVRVAADLSEEERNKLWTDYRLAVVRPVEGLSDVYVVSPIDHDEDEVTRAADMAIDSRIVWSQPNFRTPIRTHQIAISDPLYSFQWHLDNRGQRGGLAGADINAPEAWNTSTGLDVLFGIFDDSCDVDHPDLRGGYIGVGQDLALPSSAPGSDDPRPKSIGDEHGTAVMGLAAARANTIGVRGVAYLSQFTASRGLNDFIDDADIAGAYNFARQQKVDVHINSWGFFPGFPAPAIIVEAIDLAFRDGRDLDEDGPNLPRGMVLVFAAGNDGIELDANDDLASLNTVIGIGASNIFDQITSYSNFGRNIDVLAPGADDDGLIATTDNNDNAGYVDDGYNVGGFDQFTGEPEIEPTGLYTGNFSGTSAACPIAAGTAGLILSVNPDLTATDVRQILEHTCDRVSPEDAGYDPITKRSLRYGFGRINAQRAAEAALQAASGNGLTWPYPPGNFRVGAGELRFTQNGSQLEFRYQEEDFEPDDPDAPPQPRASTEDFLVVASDSPFTFDADEFPVDGVCYDDQQLGCSGAVLQTLPTGVSVIAVGCALSCDGSESLCEAGADKCVGFLTPAGTRYFGIYARNSLGRYSHGVKVDSEGNILDPGFILGETTGGGGGGGGVPVSAPRVSIEATPLSGTSPLTVRFAGNATSAVPIDSTKTAWDFDTTDSVAIDSTSRNTSYTYVVPAGQTRTFIARLTMQDTEGRAGFAQAAIRVEGSGGGDDSGQAGEASIIISIPGTVGSDVDSGTSPFTVQLSVDTSGLVGTLQSVRWDLGDGTTANSLFVSHTYVNATDNALRLPVTATVNTVTTGGTTLTTSVSRTITILPGSGTGPIEPPPLDGTTPEGPGGSVNPCAAMGMLPLFVISFTLLGMRRRRRR
ncbi:MAG: S8 family serine peptidase [Phycisphaerae bacterium]|nr:S8 family serine peptidase [Phycisphaerae bacterium]